MFVLVNKTGEEANFTAGEKALAFHIARIQDARGLRPILIQHTKDGAKLVYSDVPQRQAA